LIKPICSSHWFHFFFWEITRCFFFSMELSGWMDEPGTIDFIMITLSVPNSSFSTLSLRHRHHCHEHRCCHPCIIHTSHGDNSIALSRTKRFFHGPPTESYVSRGVFLEGTPPQSLTFSILNLSILIDGIGFSSIIVWMKDLGISFPEKRRSDWSPYYLPNHHDPSDDQRLRRSRTLLPYSHVVLNYGCYKNSEYYEMLPQPSISTALYINVNSSSSV